MTTTAFIFWRIRPGNTDLIISAGQSIRTKWQERGYPNTHKLPWLDIPDATLAKRPYVKYMLEDQAWEPRY